MVLCCIDTYEVKNYFTFKLASDDAENAETFILKRCM